VSTLHDIIERRDKRIAELERENAAWQALYDKTPKHPEGISGNEFITVHNKLMMKYRERIAELERDLAALNRRLEVRYENEMQLKRENTALRKERHEDARWFTTVAAGLIERAKWMDARAAREESG
jgi:uncharacterized protein involved in exopolysaccharide biosynthesis